MSRSRLPTLLISLVLTGLAACSGPKGSRSRSAGGEGDAHHASNAGRLVAEVEGQPVTSDLLEDRAAGRLARLRQEEYDIRRRVLEEIVSERLLEAEAKRRGVSRDELLRTEVESHLPPPAPDQVENIYQRNLRRFEGQTRDQAIARIQEALVEQSRRARRQAFEQELREKGDVSIRLEPPRFSVKIPPEAPATGPAGAPVTIVEFTDYQCPFCHRAQGVIDRVLSNYAGRVRLVHLDFPLDNHPGAVPAARAARCAGEQTRFWEYHRNLMTERGPLDTADLTSRAEALGLDGSAFASCLASDRHEEAVRADLEQGIELGVSGTPAYFINGRMVSGARPFPEFAAVIDDELAGL